MGLYKNTVMPFGLKNAPAVFQRFMNTEFTDLTATGQVIIYMDDILIATSDNITEHRKLVHKVLERLIKLDLYLKPSKCIFETRKIEFLGVILENSTVTMDPVKVAGVEEWKTPKNVKDIQNSLGSATSTDNLSGDFHKLQKHSMNMPQEGRPMDMGQTRRKGLSGAQTAHMQRTSPNTTRSDKTIQSRSRHIQLCHWCCLDAKRR
jgi:hypothetical protein